MRWVVGLDLRPHSHGAINFAQWLRAHDKQPEQLRIDGLHVVEARMFNLPGGKSRAEVVGDALKAARVAVSVRNASEAFDSVNVVESIPSVDRGVVDVLSTAAGLWITDGIILGRRGPGEHGALIRLGKVARNLLRKLPAPTFVVPPDLELAHVGPGPILCAVQLDARGVEVARYAERLARRLGRSARLVHVIDTGDPIGLQYLPEGSWDDLHARQRDDAQDKIVQWRDAAGLTAYTLLAQGQTVPRLVSAARELDACMILCGSRQLSLAERMWISSVGSSLAAAAHLPVGVIPSSES
ncbi:Universal stress protein family 4 [Enhygromyxa salina]|uniref:Universal stress protein family 4 n=2 Tax=Enhygromyxa salina TaxID=215803 RepID=A0A0C2D9Y1_9BACT|nr:Universal stress protein family 4 [Enhygromyxa salina]